VLGNVLVRRGRLELFHAQLEPPSLAVYGQHLRAHEIALFQNLPRMFQTFFRADVGNVDHALDALGDLHESAEFGEAADAAFHHAAHRAVLLDPFPGIAQRLLEAERNAPLGCMDRGDHHLDGLARLDHVRGFARLAGPGEIGKVDQSLDARLQFHESPEIRQPHHSAAHTVALLVLLFDQRPRLRRELLEPQREPLCVGVHLQDLDFDDVPGVDHVGGLVHAAPGHVRHMQQSFDPADVHEGAEVGQRFDRAPDYLPFLKRLESPAAGQLLLFFEHGAAVHHHVFARHVQLNDLAGDLLADQLFHLGRFFDPAPGGGQEGANADVHREAALNLAGHHAGNRALLAVGLLQRGPVPGSFDLDQRQQIVALRVAPADPHAKLITHGDSQLPGLVAQLGRRQHAFDFQANVHEDGIVRDSDDGSEPSLAAVLSNVAMAVLELGEQFGEGGVFRRGSPLFSVRIFVLGVGHAGGKKPIVTQSTPARFPELNLC
jgi:hypothetical protein